MMGEITVESKVPTDTLIADLSMTRRTDITHNNTCLRYDVRME